MPLEEAIPRIGARDKLQELPPEWQWKAIPAVATRMLLSYLLPIDITTMGDTKDEHGFGAIVDVQQNSIITDLTRQVSGVPTNFVMPCGQGWSSRASNIRSMRIRSSEDSLSRSRCAAGRRRTV